MFQKYVISVQKVTNPWKPIFYYLKAYVYKIYVLIKSKDDPNKLRRLQKLTSRIYIKYLVGYKSTNIYRIWILYKKKVVSVRDMIFNEEAFFDGKPIKIITELIIALDKVINLVEV